MSTIGDHFQSQESQTEKVDLIRNEIAIFKNLIQERKHPLDLVRELISNAGAKEVAATEIEISYTSAREGHIFEVNDNGCGMNYTGSSELPGRLDKFLGLGMSEIAGIKSDEFSFKGLGSKMAYHSKRVEIETRFEGHPFHRVMINEPWVSLNNGVLPNPHVSHFPDSEESTGTRIKVYGHPPHRQEEAFSLAEIRAFLQHRTFIGFTRSRESQPKITLSVLGKTEQLDFGFPEFKEIEWPDGIKFDAENKRLIVNLFENSSEIGLLQLKGFLAWDSDKYGLSKSKLNTGLTLSSRGIPYFELDLDEYGGRGIAHANPGVEKTCLVIECDGVFSKMNISRSDLVDSAEAIEFKKQVNKLFERLESSEEYLAFRGVRAAEKREKSADHIAEQKSAIESDDQNWVVYQSSGSDPIVLMREPENEAEVNALIWKLEILGALPFAKFQTLAYIGARRGPDLLVNFQEDKDSEPVRSAVVEIERNFYNYTQHGHRPAQYPKVLCWDIPPSGRKVRLIPHATKKFRYSVNKDNYQIFVFVIKLMDGIVVKTKKELRDMGVDI